MRIAMAALLLASCSVVTDLDQQKCQTDADCSEGRVCSANNFCLLTSATPECVVDGQCDDGEICANGQCEGEETARWGCVGDMPEAPVPSSKKVTLSMLIAIREGNTTVPPSAVKAVACTTPTTCEAMEFTPNDDGLVEVVVEQGFEGFVKLTGAGLLDTLYQLQAPMNADRSAGAEVTLLSSSEVSKIAKAAGALVNLSVRGVVVFALIDCAGDLSGDVSVTDIAPAPETDIVYLAANQSVDAAATATSGAGIAMALDAPSGTADFTLTRASTSAAVGAVSVATFAGAVTYVPYQFGR